MQASVIFVSPSLISNILLKRSQRSNDISKTLFEGAKEDWGEDVMASVKEFSRPHLDECVEVASVVAVEMGNVLASQRGNTNLVVKL